LKWKINKKQQSRQATNKFKLASNKVIWVLQTWITNSKMRKWCWECLVKTIIWMRTGAMTRISIGNLFLHKPTNSMVFKYTIRRQFRMLDHSRAIKTTNKMKTVSYSLMLRVEPILISIFHHFCPKRLIWYVMRQPTTSFHGMKMEMVL